MKNLRLVLTLAATVAASSAAFAQADMNALWKSLDANQDAMVSQEEGKASKMVAEQWKLLDSDSDGMLSPAEFSRLGSKQ